MMKRIETIADMVHEGVAVADIGTDHAFLPIRLIEKNICPHVYACDIAEGPLQAAAKNIRARGMQDRISVILSDGFEKVPDDVQCAVIAGMGYYTAASILEKAEERLVYLQQIIVEVNRNVAEMRQWISDHGCTIDDEAVCYEKGFDYVIISFHVSNHAPYSEKEILCGPVLMRKKGIDYMAFVRRKIQAVSSVLGKIPDASSEPAQRLQKELAQWQSIIDED